MNFILDIPSWKCFLDIHLELSNKQWHILECFQYHQTILQFSVDTTWVFYNLTQF